MAAPVTIDEVAFGRIQQELGVLQSNNLILATQIERRDAELKAAREVIESLRLRIQNSDETIRALRDELQQAKPGLRQRLLGA